MDDISPLSVVSELTLPKLGKEILGKIQSIAKELDRPITIMHICGTHEYTIAKSGLRTLLPENVRVISGPGCPVCVCPTAEIELALECARRPNTILTTFGDMIRVPGVKSSLQEEKAKGADIRIVYGPEDAIEIAKSHPEKEVVFFSIGFETTAPLPALQLSIQPPANFSIICAHRTVPMAMEVLLTLSHIHIDAFLLPGHVSAIIGMLPYIPLAEKYHSPMVVGGFEVNDVLISLYSLLKQIKNGTWDVENTYGRIVSKEGNVAAQDVMAKVFEPVDAIWRGIGMISQSGLRIRKEYQQYDAETKFQLTRDNSAEMPKGCSCDQVLIGAIPPQECPLFGKACDPRHPIGPCMVSHEGACKIAFMFQKLVKK